MRRFPLVATLLVVLLAFPAAARASDQIVVLQDGPTPVAAETAALEQEHDFDAGQRYDDVLRGFTADLTPQQVRELEADPAVEAVVRDRPVRAAGAVSAASWSSVQPGVRRVGNLPSGQVHEAATGAVAVVDTGVDLDHPDLDVVSGWDCISNDPIADDGNGHGTHVAGVIGARNNGFGITGVAPGTRIVAFRVLDNSGAGTLSSVVCGLEKVREMAPALGITVVNLSLGGGAGDSTCANDPEHRALCKLAQAGIVPVVAAGNEGADIAAVPSSADICPPGMATCRATPAVYPEVLTVAAMTETDGLPGALGSMCGGLRDGAAATTYSNFATRDADRAHLVAAPGTCVRSTWRSGFYSSQTGTSMATPHVAGLVALCDGQGGAAGPCASLSTPQVIQRMRLVGDAAGFTGVTGRDYGPLGRFSAATVAVDAAPTPAVERDATGGGTTPPLPPAAPPVPPTPPVATPAPVTGGAAAPAPGASDTLVPGTPSRSLPTVTLTAAKTSLAAFRRSGLRVRIAGPVTRGTLRLTVSRSTARKLRLKSTTLASVRVTKAGTARLRVGKATARTLARARGTLAADLRLVGTAPARITFRR